MTTFMFLLILLGVFLNASAQLLLKAGMDQVGHFAFSWANVWPIGLETGSNPFIIIGILCYIISVVVWLLVLSRVDVSIAYPMVSIGYIVSAIAAYYLLGETITMQRILGILVILTGVYLVARS